MATKSFTGNTLDYAKEHLREIGVSQASAQETMIKDIVEQFNFTDAEAKIIFRVYLSKKVKAIKYVNRQRKYQITHGAY